MEKYVVVAKAKGYRTIEMAFDDKKVAIQAAGFFHNSNKNYAVELSFNVYDSVKSYMKKKPNEKTLIWNSAVSGVSELFER